jgi:hypothetical protein
MKVNFYVQAIFPAEKRYIFITVATIEDRTNDMWERLA